LAFVAPLVFIVIDKLFLDTGLSGLVLERFTYSNQVIESTRLLLTGIVFSAVCIFIATIKRSQRI